ncbi:hypothetical protein E4U41_004621 [Claviceps citrina]|nr:hypothetical protein E4U41_004621 [Claviceps citrina]
MRPQRKRVRSAAESGQIGRSHGGLKAQRLFAPLELGSRSVCQIPSGSVLMMIA